MVFGPPALLLDGGATGVATRPASSVQAFGAANACAAWSDGCVLCTRERAGPALCSTPGIACTPRAIACTAPASP